MEDDDRSLSMSSLSRGIDATEDEGELQAALTRIQSKLLRLKKRPATAKSPLFNKLPPEVRNMIYRLLLCNPFLGQIDAIHPRIDFGASISYDLCPAILRTCRQAHEEASLILYKENQFVVSCVGFCADSVTLGYPYRIASPLARYYGMEGYSSFNDEAALQELPGFDRVSKWRLVMSRYARSEYAVDRQPVASLLFCRAVIAKPPELISVVFKPKKFCDDWKGGHYGLESHAAGSAFLETRVLAPLNILRGVGDLCIEGSTTDPKLQVLEIKYKAITTSKEPLEHAFMMYEKLIRYAQSFERDESWREDMETSIEEYAENHRWESIALLQRRTSSFRPFTTNSPHPVEDTLRLSKYSSEDNDVTKFKRHRKTVLDYLEPQYQRIAAAGKLLADFVSQQGTNQGVLDYNRRSRIYTEAVIVNIMKGQLLLDSYAESFNRDVPQEIEMILRKNKDLFVERYEDLDREKNLKIVDRNLRDNNFRGWRRHFCLAAKDMQEQQKEIEMARKELFEFDLPGLDRGCDIILQS